MSKQEKINDNYIMDNICQNHLVTVGWKGKLNGCPVCTTEAQFTIAEEMVNQQAERIKELEKAFADLDEGAICGAELDRDVIARQAEQIERLKEYLKKLLPFLSCTGSFFVEKNWAKDLRDKIEQELAAQPQKGQNNVEAN